jgi:hypothetical protein
MHNINRMTAGDTAFGANQAAKLEQAQQMASSLNNLANATIRGHQCNAHQSHC